MSALLDLNQWDAPRAGRREDGPTLVVAEATASPADRAAWEAAVATLPGSTVFHRWAWQEVVERTYGHPSRRLWARDGDTGRVRGLLPLGLVRGPFTGRALISIPYAVRGGVAADDPAVAARLHDEARSLAARRGVRYLELRGGIGTESAFEAAAGFQVRDHYVGFRRDLPTDPAAVLGQFPRKARAAVRQARDQFGLTARFGPDQLATFQDLYAGSLRRLGSPGHARRFLARLAAALGDEAIVEVAYQGATPVAGVLAFRFGDTVLPYFAGIDERYNALNASNYLYFALMEHAVALGLRQFDFGRTRRDNRGGCQFKTNQGFEPEPMPYSYHSPTGLEPPDLRPSYAAFSRPRQVWRRLPLAVTGPLGGVISRWLP